MQTSEREDFEEQLAILCAGFNVPATVHRKHAYFAGLAKMSMAQFVRCVEYAVSEAGPDELPTSKEIWRIHRDFRKHPAVQSVPQVEEEDHLLFFANRLFFEHFQHRGGLGSMGRLSPGHGLVDCGGSRELIEGRRALRELVEWYLAPISEGDPDATPQAFITALIAAVDRVSPLTPHTRASWLRRSEDAQAAQPFPVHMGRPIPEKYAPVVSERTP